MTALVQAQTDPNTNPQLRVDTRLYLNGASYPRYSGTCIGIVWMCNPGSCAGPPSWGPCKRDLDITLKAVGGILLEAEKIARTYGRGMKNGEYIQILNLHYVLNSNTAIGWSQATAMAQPYAETPNPNARFCWLAWGSDVRHPFVVNALSLLGAHPRIPYFYFDEPTSRIIYGPPIHPSYPLHPRRISFNQNRNSRSAISKAISIYM